MGIAAVEFSLVAIVFFTLFFGIVEFARAMYMFNTLQEVTRRAAALATKADFSNIDAMQNVREQAVFRNDKGILAFGSPISDDNINIDYMRIAKDGTTLTAERIPDDQVPASPADNLANCARNPYGGNCIRLVRARVCQETSGETCTTVQYETLVALVPMPLGLPRAPTIMTAETFDGP